MLSLILFNIYTNDLIYSLNKAKLGIEILKCKTKFLNSLNYADYLVLLAPSLKKLQIRFNIVIK